MTKLRQAMIDAMLVRGFADRTHESYLSSVEGLAKYYGYIRISQPMNCDNSRVSYWF